MPITPLTVYGRLSLEYTAFGIPHVVRVYVEEFNQVSAVGTFIAPSTPASLDVLATDLTGLIKPMYESGSVLTWGAWIGEEHVVGTDNTFIPVVDGTITPGTASYGTGTNYAGPVAQMTFSFRDSDHKGARLVLVGVNYFGPIVAKYSVLGAASKALADYMMGTSVIKSRGNRSIQSLVSATWDTNDALTRRYRR